MIGCEDSGERAGQVVADALSQYGHSANVSGVRRQEMILQESEAPCGGGIKCGSLSFKPQELAPRADKEPINGVRFQDVGARQADKFNSSEFVGFDRDTPSGLSSKRWICHAARILYPRRMKYLIHPAPANTQGGLAKLEMI